MNRSSVRFRQAAHCSDQRKPWIPGSSRRPPGGQLGGHEESLSHAARSAICEPRRNVLWRSQISQLSVWVSALASTRIASRGSTASGFSAQRTRHRPPPTPEMPTRHAWVSAWQGRRRRARATPALSQSVEVGDIRVVPDAPRNRLGSAAAHQRDDIEGRGDARKQPAPPGPESGEGAPRSAGTPRVIEHESARIRWPHGSTWPVGRQGSSESARASRFFAPRSGQHRLVLGAA